ARYLKLLAVSLGSLERVLGDLSQPDADKWSGSAASRAASTFKVLGERYRRDKEAVAEVESAVKAANDARARARAAFDELPSAQVPSWIQGAVTTVKKVGDVNVVIDGYAYVADQAVGIFENWLGDKREQQAQQVLQTLEEEL